jgi:hypothetical protein
VELKARDLAVVASTLNVGSLAETVEVTAAGALITMGANNRKSKDHPEAHPMPGKPPAAATVTSGTRILAVDSVGALFYSKNAGKHWKAVTPKWHGKVVQIALLVQPSSEATPKAASVFQLTTDSGSVWLSKDGIHWYPSTGPR